MLNSETVLFRNKQKKYFFALKFLDAQIQRKPAVVWPIIGLYSIGRKVNVSDKQIIRPDLSSSLASHWEWLHSCLNNEQKHYDLLLRNHVIARYRRKKKKSFH